MKYRLPIAAALAVAALTGTALGADVPVGQNSQAIALQRWYGISMASAGIVVGNSSPDGQASTLGFDGANIWVGHPGGSFTVIDRVHGGNMVTAQFDLRAPAAMLYDGRYMWVTSVGKNEICRLSPPDPSNGNQIALAGCFPTGIEPEGIAFDGGAMWLANYNSNTITRLRAEDGLTLGT